MISYSTIHKFIRECEAAENINLINFALIQNNEVIAQFCKKPYKKCCKQLLFSMTKSFTSLAVGIAYDKGLLALNDYVTAFFKDEIPENPHPNLKLMRLSHLLTMTTGIHDNTYTELFAQPNWITAFLSQDFPHEPGTYYRYSTHATHMLSAVIEKTSNESLEDFLNANLFYPMEIKNAQWEHSPEGLIAGGMGLSLCPSDLIKMAIMLLNKGVFNGKRIISEKYLSLATSPQVVKQDEINVVDKYFSGSEYGYQFHLSPNGTYRADGAFGQFCIIHPEKNIAIIATSQRTKTENILALVDKYLLSGCVGDNNISKESLSDYFQQLSFDTPKMSDEKKSSLEIHNLYELENNELNIKTVQITDNHIIFRFTDNSHDEIAIDFCKPVYGHSHFIKDLQIHLQEHCVYAEKVEDNIVILTIYYIETPYVVKYSLEYKERKLNFSFNANVSLTLKNFSVFGFKM